CSGGTARCSWYSSALVIHAYAPSTCSQETVAGREGWPLGHTPPPLWIPLGRWQRHRCLVLLAGEEDAIDGQPLKVERRGIPAVDRHRLVEAGGSRRLRDDHPVGGAGHVHSRSLPRDAVEGHIGGRALVEPGHTVNAIGLDLTAQHHRERGEIDPGNLDRAS